jgi:DNA (cytosine-5)-methyltransferase 1
VARRRKMLVADLLCGAGGSSTGAQRALGELGLEMELVCVNHWPTAIETHKRNHPEARHYCQDIATVRPHLIVPEGYLDLLMASPTCTHHSVARGGKPTSDQQRSDPWHIVTWLTELRVKRIIIENVWEFIGWGPVDPRTGKPIASRKGEYFKAWIDVIRRLGYEPEWRKLNAADYGDATTRQRFILMARNDGRPLVWPVPTHMKRPEGTVAHFAGVKPWRAAREIIDWSLKGKSIFNRKKPLSPKTLQRIYAGAVKFNWPEPFLVILRQHMGGKSLAQPLPTIAAGGNHIGLAQPVMVANRTNNAAKDPGTDPVPCPTTAPGGGIVLAQPVIVRTDMHGRKSPGARGAGDPLMTITTAGGIGVAEPFMLSRQGGGGARSVEQPTPTQVAKHSHVLIEPAPLIASYYGQGNCRSTDEPLPTVTTLDRFGMVVPVTNGSGGPRPRSTEEPIPTMTTAKGGEHALVMPVTHHDVSSRARDANEDPLPTITGANRGDMAFITAAFGERPSRDGKPGQAPRVHDVSEPTPTICAEGRINLVEGAGPPELQGYDILFRMLEPHELAAAMGFDSEEARYEFVGTKTDKTKQIGNAVSVAKMKACVGAIMADAAVPQKAEPKKAARRKAA